MIAILYFLTVYALESLGTSTVGWVGARTVLGDYAYVVGTAVLATISTDF